MALDTPAQGLTLAQQALTSLGHLPRSTAQLFIPAVQHVLKYFCKVWRREHEGWEKSGGMRVLRGVHTGITSVPLETRSLTDAGCQVGDSKDS